jgi:lysophospholipase
MTCLDLAPLPELKDATIACVKSTKGVMLRAAVFTAKGNAPKGTVCLFQGRTEYIEKYAETIEDLRQRGFCVATLDWRGQGGSSRLLENKLKGHVETYADYDADLKAFMEEVVLKSCPKPFYALSHSTGGLNLMRAAAQNTPWFEKFIFSSPFLGLANSPGLAKLTTSALNFFGQSESYIPGSKDKASFKGKFAGNRLTSDENRFNTMAQVGAMRQDLFIGAPTVGWVYQSIKAYDEIHSTPSAQFTKKPMLIVAAGNDDIVSTPATKELAKRLPQATLVVIEGAQHEVLMEKDALRNQFWAAFDKFLAA